MAGSRIRTRLTYFCGLLSEGKAIFFPGRENFHRGLSNIFLVFFFDNGLGGEAFGERIFQIRGGFQRNLLQVLHFLLYCTCVNSLKVLNICNEYVLSGFNGCTVRGSYAIEVFDIILDSLDVGCDVV